MARTLGENGRECEPEREAKVEEFKDTIKNAGKKLETPMLAMPCKASKGKKHHNETRSQNHRVALDWLFDRISLDPKIQNKHIDTKNQLADMLTKGKFTRDEWNHLLCLLNIGHFSSAECSEVMSKRTQKDSGEERVTKNKWNHFLCLFKIV